MFEGDTHGMFLLSSIDIFKLCFLAKVCYNNKMIKEYKIKLDYYIFKRYILFTFPIHFPANFFEILIGAQFKRFAR